MPLCYLTAGDLFLLWLEVYDRLCWSLSELLANWDAHPFFKRTYTNQSLLNYSKISKNQQPSAVTPCPAGSEWSYLVEKQLQYPAQVLVLRRRGSLGARLSEVGVQKCNDARQQPLILHAGWMHLEKPAGQSRQRENNRRIGRHYISHLKYILNVLLDSNSHCRWGRNLLVFGKSYGS